MGRREPPDLVALFVAPLNRLDPLHRWGLERREQVTVDGEPVWLAPPEFVIMRKLPFFRDGGSSMRLRDVRSMASLLGNRLDRATLEEQVAALGPVFEWAKVAEII